MKDIKNDSLKVLTTTNLLPEILICVKDPIIPSSQKRVDTQTKKKIFK